MATTAKTYLDLDGLKAYDALIKSWANSDKQLAYKTVLKVNDELWFYKKPNATESDVPDKKVNVGSSDIAKQLDELAAIAGATWDSTTEKYTIDLDVSFASATKTVVNALNELKGQINTLNSEDNVSGSVKKTVKDAIEALDVNELPLATISGGVVKISGIKEIDGKISKGDGEVTLAKVAGTGAAADVAYTGTIGSTVVTNVDDAIDALAEAAAEGVESKTVYITQTPGESSSTYSKRYSIYQGATGTVSSPVVSEHLIDIDIPKDMVVEEGEVVEIVFKSSDNTLHEGSESGPDVTEAIKGAGGTATSADAGKYIKLTIANATADTLYIKATDLVDIYSGGENAETKVNIDNSNVITVNVKEIDSNKISYTSGATVKVALDVINGNASTPGSIRNIVDGAVEGAIGDLATDNPVPIASYTGAATSGAATTITFITGISESDGVIEGEEDTITLTTISDDELASLFS